MKRNIEIEDQFYKKAIEKAREMGMNFSAFVRYCIYEFMKGESR